MNVRLAFQVLRKHEVAFLVVGGLAVVAHGAALMTRDIDIVYKLTLENVQRLVAAFLELDAVAYGDARRLRFSFSHLNNTGHHLAETRAGRIDALGAIGVRNELRYEDLVDDSIELEAFGERFRCIGLERLIEVKRSLGRPKDLLAVMELEAIRKLKAEQGSQR